MSVLLDNQNHPHTSSMPSHHFHQQQIAIRTASPAQNSVHLGLPSQPKFPPSSHCRRSLNEGNTNQVLSPTVEIFFLFFSLLSYPAIPLLLVPLSTPDNSEAAPP
ncbi:uncharacterized protein BO72DRAFT_35830 [Aspergillus fijiensis CBS 313.89]|uniref:Uncharacterized protein n=1 Tax=Aspergillus fijiensis CBS 313.89 TaxID=1448319 RepID=A0A8G1RVN5_9EURO|nr:uncharacterized protein BO72DRAFT_35830 [Aspergillus fijiensis CBS 313.89]RAK79754.1 hypothetical protein BO72DRAFT_35830 [Aspergillus fijiensis CBS 313.89]